MIRGLKRVLNLHEEATHARLREACDAHSAHVFAKVRLADVLPIEDSGVSDELYRYALQSHFDFIVTNEQHDPLFCVEFDGPTHQSLVQQERDDKKNKLCDRFEFPLLRINARYIGKKYRDMDLLTWFVEVWFAQQWFDEAQRRGEIAGDEPFMPMAMVSLPGRSKQFPLWLSANVRTKIQKLFFANRIRQLVPSTIIGTDKAGNYHAISFVKIDDERGVVVETGMHAQQFPVREREALDEIVTVQLYEALDQALEGNAAALAAEEIERRIADFVRSYNRVFAIHDGASYRVP